MIVFVCQSFVTFVIGGFIYFSKDALCKLVWTVIGRTCNIQKVAMACQPQTNVSPTCQPQTNVSLKQMSTSNKCQPQTNVNPKQMSAPLVSPKQMSASNKCQPHLSAPSSRSNECVTFSARRSKRDVFKRINQIELELDVLMFLSYFLQNRK